MLCGRYCVLGVLFGAVGVLCAGCARYCVLGGVLCAVGVLCSGCARYCVLGVLFGAVGVLCAGCATQLQMHTGAHTITGEANAAASTIRLGARRVSTHHRHCTATLHRHTAPHPSLRPCCQLDRGIRKEHREVAGRWGSRSRE